MSRYGELDKAALDRWITRSDDDPNEAAFEKWVEENRDNEAFKKEFSDDRLDYDFHPESPEWDDEYDQWLYDTKCLHVSYLAGNYIYSVI